MKALPAAFGVFWDLLAFYGLMNVLTPTPRSEFGAMALMAASVGALAWIGMRYRAARVARIARVRGVVWRSAAVRE